MKQEPEDREGGQQVICPDCKHDLHEPGRCKFDNRGQNEINKLTSVRVVKLSGPRTFSGMVSSLMTYGYDKGHRVSKRRSA